MRVYVASDKVGYTATGAIAELMLVCAARSSKITREGYACADYDTRPRFHLDNETVGRLPRDRV